MSKNQDNSIIPAEDDLKLQLPPIDTVEKALEAFIRIDDLIANDPDAARRLQLAINAYIIRHGGQGASPRLTQWSRMRLAAFAHSLYL